MRTCVSRMLVILINYGGLREFYSTSVADTVRVHVYEDKPYCRPYSTVLVRCTAVHVHIQYIFMDGNRIFYHTKLSNLRRYESTFVRKYESTFESTFEGTKVRRYESTFVQSTFVLSYFRKYFRTKEKYEGTKVQ